ncbi:MAG: ethanolamine ammonia-lyase subunit EutC [Acidobacteriaceae bacterium]
MADLKAEGIWPQLRQFTPARIGLGRVGASVPTPALLAFDLAHARARDAVHASLDSNALAAELETQGFRPPLLIASQARDRMEYLLRPDRGRRLDADSRDRLRKRSATSVGPVIVIADGLSALAVARHATPIMRELSGCWPGGSMADVPVAIARQGRVALGDEVGELLGAETVVVLIGERPGLSSPDSLGAYFTWKPHVGRTDAERNCISNIRPEGLPYAEAASRLAWLLAEARRLRLSGIGLKDDSDEAETLLL